MQSTKCATYKSVHSLTAKSTSCDKLKQMQPPKKPLNILLFEFRLAQPNGNESSCVVGQCRCVCVYSFSESFAYYYSLSVSQAAGQVTSSVDTHDWNTISLRPVYFIRCNALNTRSFIWKMNGVYLFVCFNLKMREKVRVPANANWILDLSAQEKRKKNDNESANKFTSKTVVNCIRFLWGERKTRNTFIYSFKWKHRKYIISNMNRCDSISLPIPIFVYV